MFFTSAQIIALVLQYKYMILFPISVLEGPIVTMIAGTLVSLQQMDFLLVYIIVVVGDLVGDSIYYAVGHYGRHSFIHRWGGYFGLTDERVQTVEDHFEKHPGKTLIIGKITHAIGTVILFAAGMSRVPYWKFIWYNLVGTVPKSLALLLLGYFFGHAYNQINDNLSYVSGFIVVVVLVAVVIYFYKQRKISSVVK